MHTSVHSPPAPWQGWLFLIFGIVLLLMSPRIVRWQDRFERWKLIQIKRVMQRLLDFVGYDGAFVLSRFGNQWDDEQDSTGWDKLGSWFVALLFAAFGVAILLKVPNLSIGP